MINTYSSTIRRKEMEAVLVCMVDERLGPGEACSRLVQSVKEYTSCDGAVALRSPSLALEYALLSLVSSGECALEAGSSVMISALAPCWQFLTLEKMGYKPLVLDVCEENGLVTPEICAEGVRQGGKLLVLTESMGVLPDIDAFLSLGVPVIEDISQAALARYPVKDAVPVEGEDKPKGKAAGMCGVYAIFGMEDRDIVTAGGGAVLMAPARKAWVALKALVEKAPSTDLMPDMNASLAYVELKEYYRNEAVRKELFALYSHAIMSGRHKTYTRAEGDAST
ncbi:MAG: DegT/DnrJ/EryC1/StrS aminotransferase family protein, partial [Treponema sp.]|nr:DegT/DnrJ/EryC1/StrS aminotransferase family protein [Treponema sp.]